MLIIIIVHLNTLDDPLIRMKWMNVKKAISEETEVVKQLDAERRAFKEIPVDDPDMWKPPSQDSSRRPVRTGQVGTRKSPQDGTWARGSTRTTGRGAKTVVSGRTNTRARASTTGRKSTVTGKSSKAESSNGDAEDGKSKRGQYEGPDPDLAEMLKGMCWKPVQELDGMMLLA